MPIINSVAQAQINKIAEDCKQIKPLVAIQCITYNHESYIRDALEGFVTQKTEFPFVAIVHDDASTDGTALIIREYAEKYPDIIKPIYETENQYSKKDGTLTKILNDAIEALNVKYVALCEGDDYWIDELKLKTQIDFLENNLEYGMCYTNSHILKNEKLSSFNVFNGSKSIGIRDMIIAGGGLCPTATIVLRFNIYKDFHKIISPLPVGDYPLQVYCAYKSEVRYLNIITSVYRFGNNGSWTAEKRKAMDIESRIANSRIIDQELNRITFGKYECLFDILEQLYCFKINLQYKGFIAALKYAPCLIHLKTAYKYFNYLYKLHIAD